VALLIAVCLTLSGCGGPSKVTKENADKIKKDMNEAEVKAILGEPNIKQDVMGMKQMVWKEGNKTITVQFMNDKVVQSMATGF